jgi:hypothetical protein
MCLLLVSCASYPSSDIMLGVSEYVGIRLRINITEIINIRLFRCRLYANLMVHNKNENVPIYFKIELTGIDENVLSKEFLFLFFFHIHHT